MQLKWSFPAPAPAHPSRRGHTWVLLLNYSTSPGRGPSFYVLNFFFNRLYPDVCLASFIRIKFSVEIEQETDGRWIAEIAQIPGAMAYGSTREEAIARVEALALRVLAERIEQGELSPEIAQVFSVAAAWVSGGRSRRAESWLPWWRLAGALSANLVGHTGFKAWLARFRFRISWSWGDRTAHVSSRCEKDWAYRRRSMIEDAAWGWRLGSIAATSGSEVRRQRTENRGQGSEEKKMTKHEWRMTKEWCNSNGAFLILLMLIILIEGVRTGIRSEVTRQMSAARGQRAEDRERFRHMTIEVIAAAVGPALVTPS